MENTTETNNTELRYLRVEPRPEWWSPSEYCRRPYSIRLSVVNGVGRLGEKAIWVSKGISDYEPDSGFDYDTPKHRDEDFERLKNCLGIGE